MKRILGLLVVLALAAGSAQSQLDGSLAEQFHQGTPGIDGKLEADHFGTASAFASLRPLGARLLRTSAQPELAGPVEARTTNSGSIASSCPSGAP